MSPIALLCLALLGSARASAQASDAVAPGAELILPHCEPASWRREALRATLELELESGPTAAGWRIEITSACAAHDLRAGLQVRAPNGTIRTREVTLADTPAELHARTLALAAAEALRAQSAASDAAPLSPPLAAATSSARPGTPPSAAGAVVLSLQPALRIFLARRDAELGGELSLALGSWVFGLAGLFGAFSDPLGNIGTGQATLTVAYRWLVLRAGRVSFNLGPRVGLGILWANATGGPDAHVESAMSAITWDAGAELAAHYALGRWQVGLHCSGGYALGARHQADERVLAELTGPFLSAALSVGIRL